ncbi:MAG: 5-(carboxyamino)imidazole ribonucleotide synthase [Parvularcula sp.]|jgi:5-(carboxyamino)imidazole ribonucleotide synthase|nr:5-(carboxyamino)imidazole ribonucleotide synthase [Parvularcula sp.]
MTLDPGSRIGILGVGQLGRMLASAAAKLGFRTAVYGPDASRSPAGSVTDRAVEGAYEDDEAVARFAAACDVVTYEFENVPASTAVAVSAAGIRLAPNAGALAASQERLREKSLFRELSIPTVDFWPVENAGDLTAALREAGPSILKTRRFGYDGKGQRVLAGTEDAEEVLADLGGGPWLLEAKASFEREVSVVAARSLSGEVAFFDLAENRHKNGILDRTILPAPNQEAFLKQAQDAARRLLEHLDYVGVLTVEFFDCGGRLLANEMAPRVHNSGHLSLEACATSQFEQHIRAIAGWPLGSPATRVPSEMTNLIGHDADDWLELLSDPSLSLTLYGKRTARPGRKMGHVVRPL